jgi:Domain of unknown function (DUF5666)
MNMNRHKSLIGASLTLLLLAACSSGGLGDVLGGGGGTSNYEIRGTVDHVDTSNRTIHLTNVSGYNSSMLSSGGSGNSVRVFYDDRTTVSYSGQSYRPEDLERGDQVTVRVDEQGNNLLAESMTVTHNVSAGSSSGMPAYGTNLRGTVRYIDSSRRTLEVDRFGGGTVTVDFDTNTPVYFDNRTFRVTDLERGDEVDIRTRDLGSGRMAATDITVTRSISGTGGAGTTSNNSIIRGTVRYVDTSRREIELESTNWISGFNSGSTSASRRIIRYDANTRVDVSGQLQPVSGLEAGDIVEVQVDNPNSTTLFASRIFLVRDVRGR